MNFHNARDMFEYASFNSSDVVQTEITPQITINTIAAQTNESLSSIAATVNEKLNKRYSREDKQGIAETIAEWLLARNRLLKDISNPEEPSPYLLLDDGKAVALEKASRDVALAISDAGVNITENAFNWTLANLVYRCTRNGREVVLSRFTKWQHGKFYVSSGPTKMVVVEAQNDGVCFTIAPNGYEGVLFSADGCLPKWNPTEQPMQLGKLNAFKPILEAPPEVAAYAPELQLACADAWILAVLMQIRPLPMLMNLGQHSSGKSTNAKAIIKLFMGETADLATTPCSPRDFSTCATSLQIYGLDNLDGTPEKWLPDLLAQTSTGGMVEERLLYTNGTVYRKALQSALLITTRTAAFASRPDIMDRAVPLFFGSRTDFSISEREILNEVIVNRDALITGLAIQAIQVHSQRVEESSPDNRFTEFGRILFALWPGKAASILDALNKAKRLSLCDEDTLLQAFYKWEGGDVYGNATQIIKTLDPNGDQIKHFGGGQKIARALREAIPTLKIAGWTIEEGKARGTSVFRFTPPSKKH